MKTAVVVDCLRTPIGRAHKERGLFRDVRSDDLAVACIKAFVTKGERSFFFGSWTAS